MRGVDAGNGYDERETNTILAIRRVPTDGCNALVDANIGQW
jgi:hypothetical protein